ncbi:hypothetical protein CHL78_007050 [Romboutsia weinsteinii]|uniref:Bacterial Pleckstrin homology domain-containing protein n=1 Tax=Romboutsia weinsteinii TaxID=2020949 RepID=A0A371J5J3_9FIRM|nr:PH domain-containing protein [Romboutsia weinsteinii]RDY28052.1 hypothetical protein CHL78_007050 [Romboutsia weinsteinii]
MYMIIMSLCGIIMVLSVYMSMKSSLKPRNNIFMGVTLPKEIIDSEIVKQIKNEYKKECNKYLLIMVVSYIPVILISKISLNMIYFLSWSFIWCESLLYRPYKKRNQKLKKLKLENNWFAGERKVVHLDTKMTMLKHKMPISSKYFIIPLLLSFIPVSMSISNQDEYGIILIIVAVINILVVIVLFFIFRNFNKSKLKVYSENTDINYTINREEKRLYSIFWLIQTIIYDFITILLFIYILGYFEIGYLLVLIPILIGSGSILFGMSYIKNRVGKLEEELTSSDNKEILVDEDDYWIDGLYYYNENDSSTSVRARLGTGYTYNLATKSGKFVGKTLIWIIVSVVCIPLAIMLLSMDFIPHSINIDDTKKEISIKCTTYNYDFDISNIESVEFLNSIPKFKIKTNGAATNEYAIGNFRSNEYGKCKVYVHYENNSSILIKLKNGNTDYVIYNDKRLEKTHDIYKEIKNSIKK